MSTVEDIACAACHQVICSIPLGSRKLPGSKTTIAIAKRDHKKLCVGRDSEKTHNSRMGKCPVCCKAMRKDNIPKHCARIHKAELIQSMKAEDLADALRHKVPMAFGYKDNRRIVGVCFHCEKGGAICAKDNAGLYQNYFAWKRIHKNCIDKFPMDCFTHNELPRKQLENTITTVSFADDEDEETEAPPRPTADGGYNPLAQREGAPLPQQPVGGCGVPQAQGGLELPEQTLKALRQVSGYETDDECEESLLELIETALESQQMWKERYLALVAKGGL